MREPVNRTILLFDVERFSRRDNVVQGALRRTLTSVVDQTLVAAGIEANRQYREDRGDGMIVLLGGDVAKTDVLRALLTVTPDLLHEHNRLASRSAQMRLRIVLAAGEISHDPQRGTTGGIVGHDLNQAFRLLDSNALREELAERTGEGCVLMVSAAVYEGIVRHGHRGLRPEQFRRTDVRVKDGVLPAWLHGRPGTGAARGEAAGAAGTHTGDEGAEAAGTHRPPQTPSPSPSQPAARTAELRPAPPPEAAAPSAEGWPDPRPQAAAHTAAADPDPQPQTPPERPAGAVFTFNGSPVVHGSLVGGDQHGVSGGQVTGDVVLGGLGSDGRAGGGKSDGEAS